MREAKLIKGLVEGKTVATAAVDAGFKGSRETARVEAYRTLRKPHFLAAYDAALTKAGLSVDKVAKVIADAAKANKIIFAGDEMLEVEDHPTRLKAVEVAGRFRGHVDSPALTAAAAAAGAVLSIGYFIAKGREERGLPPL